ncbi:MAG: hypothetical protein WAZ27_00645 [Minisyncoccia bacterium]
MDNKREALISISAAAIVLLTSMVDPAFSIMIATAAFTLMGGYHYMKK